MQILLTLILSLLIAAQRPGVSPVLKQQAINLASQVLSQLEVEAAAPVPSPAPVQTPVAAAPIQQQSMPAVADATPAPVVEAPSAPAPEAPVPLACTFSAKPYEWIAPYVDASGVTHGWNYIPYDASSTPAGQIHAKFAWTFTPGATGSINTSLYQAVGRTTSVKREDNTLQSDLAGVFGPAIVAPAQYELTVSENGQTTNCDASVSF